MRRSSFRGLLATALLAALLLIFSVQVVPVQAAGIVGNGAPESCTDAALDAALVGGGDITFNCGPSPYAIIIATQKVIAADTALDGAGLITLRGHGSRHFLVNAGATLQLTSLVLSDGYVSSDGGSIYNSGTVIIEDSLLANNQTDTAYSGGAIVNYGSLTIRGSTLEGNSGGGGGAVYPRWSSSRTVIENSILRRNTAASPTSGWGGAILLWDGAVLEIADSVIEDNTAVYGGGIFNFPTSSILMRRTIVRGNTAEYGAGIYNERAILGLDDSLVLANTATRFGGGIDNRGGAVTITGGILNDNAADYLEGTGGALNNNTGYNAATGQSEPGVIALTDVGVAGNRAGMAGGGIYNASQAQLTRVTLDHNTAQRGAALFNQGDLEVSTSTLSDNTADYHGGALYQAEGAATVRYTTLADNSAGDGSALYLDLGQREATRFEGVIVAGGACGGDIPQSLGYNLENSATCGFDQPTDLVDTDPLLGLLDANGGLTRTRLPDFTSPAANAGGAECPSPDQRGEPRPAGAACDVGAVEAVELPPVCDPSQGCTSQPPSAPADPQARTDGQVQALARLRGASTGAVDVLFAAGALQHAAFVLPGPTGVYTDDLAFWFLDTYKDLLGTEDAWQLIRRSPDEQHLFFRQLHAGIPVFPAEIAVHLDGATVVGASGAYLPGLTLTAEPALSREQAEQIARDAIDPLADVLGDTQLRYVNVGLLGQADKVTHLAWGLALSAAEGDFTVFVDAHSGEVLFRDVRRQDGYDLDLENGNNTELQNLCGLFDDDDIGPGFDADAAVVSNNIWQTYYYWRNTFGRDSYDDDGEQIEWNIHVRYPDTNGNPSPNASYSPGCDIFGSSTGRTARDTVGHEFTHAVVHDELGLPYQNEQGALNESLADTFGAFLDGNWLHGDRYSPAVRDLANPPNFNQPDRFGSPLRVASTNDPKKANDYGGVHINSGILNKATFLITDGQNGFNDHNVRGIGRPKAQQLYYNVLVHRLRGNSDFADMARQMVAEAKSLRAAGAFSAADVCSVIEAYAAVELGPADRDCNGVEDSVQDDDGDGVPNAYPDSAGTPWDNCRTFKNTNQADHDGDGQGDVCDSDTDNDGVSDYYAGNPNDNCRWIFNPSQSDRDKDGVGDACDDDSDGDYVVNSRDNCPAMYNPDQSDIDRDRVGDVCDLDSDADLVCNIGGPRGSGLGLIAGQGCFPGQGSVGGLATMPGGYGMLRKPADNCPLNANTGQADADTDGVGDACDLCPGVKSSDNGDPDRDGRGNACDEDDDNDGVLDYGPDGVTPLDNCREQPNPTQIDTDRNGVGMVCDPAEQATWLKLRQKGVQVRFRAGDVIPVPIDNCPQCGAGYLPKGLETQVILQSPVAIAARVVDSGGFVVAKSTNFNTTAALRFKAPPFAGFSLRAPGLQAASAGAEQVSPGLPPSDMQYILEIAPADGVDVTQEYELVVTTDSIVSIADVWAYLPMLSR